MKSPMVLTRRASVGSNPQTPAMTPMFFHATPGLRTAGLFPDSHLTPRARARALVPRAASTPTARARTLAPAGWATSAAARPTCASLSAREDVRTASAPDQTSASASQASRRTRATKPSAFHCSCRSRRDQYEFKTGLLCS